MSDDRLVHARTLKSHPGFRFQRRFKLVDARRDLDGRSFRTITNGRGESGGAVNHLVRYRATRKKCADD